ncbi:MAG TPA: GLUG motif-containing protein [Rhizomicrobium sp.]|nr:GLUG motif-containing protein [Rhizomicrobium sp.]
MSVRNFAGTAIVIVTSALLCGAAQAALVVHGGSLNNMSCVHNVCTATGPNAVMNVKRLQNMLSNADVTLVAGNGANDIDIETAVTWTSLHRLTLDAPRSIAIDKHVSVAGTGALTLTTNDGGSGGTLSFAATGSVYFWDTASSLIINGGTYTLCRSVSALAAAVAAHPANNFALVNNYDATPDGAYAAAPIPTTLTGAFDGLGNTISHVKIQNTTNTGNIGLFAKVGTTGAVRDIIVSQEYIALTKPDGVYTAANVGGLVGLNTGSLENVSVVKSAIKGASGSKGHGPFLFESVGGIAGISDGSIVNAFADAALTTRAKTYSGGLVGSTDAASSSAIANSHATGNVISKAALQTTAGGLVGNFGGPGTITNSYATGTVSGAQIIGYAGGLVGWFGGTTISGSHATGAVSQADLGGGLAGVNIGTIIDSYATGSVGGITIGGGSVGGLVGVNQGTVESSFATGAATGYANARVGGLVGDNAVYKRSPGAIRDCYALGNATAGTGAVNSDSGAGGLVGANFDGSISTSYSTGVVTASTGTFIGGLVGFDQSNSGSLASTYWDTTTSGITNGSQGAGNIANDPGITGLTDGALKSGIPTGFDSGIWGQNGAINNALPYLLANPPS